MYLKNTFIKLNMKINLKYALIIIAICMGVILLGTKVYATTGKTINDSTRMREKASTNSNIVETILKNETVEIIEKEGDWYKATYQTTEGKKTGYIRSDLLEVKEEKKETENTKEKNIEDEEKEVEGEEIEEKDKEEKSKKEDEKSETLEENITENIEIELKTDIQLKLLPLIFSCNTGKIPANTKVTVTEIIGNWCRLQSDEQEGWVIKSLIENKMEVKTVENNEQKEETSEETKKEEKKQETTNTKLYVNTTTLNVREKADTKAEVVTQLDRNDEVTVLEIVDNTWTKVKRGNYTGYVASQYLSKTKDTTSRGMQEIRTEKKDETKKTETKKEESKKTTETTKKETTKTTEATKKESKKTTETKKEESKKTTETTKKETTKKETSSKKSSSKVTGSDIIEYAKKFLGCKYVYGATGPKTFDCSGFTQFVYKHFGYSISRTSGSQRNDGKVIKSKSDLQLGDIVCFTGHVGMYVGNGNFIHASHTGSDVKISSLNSSYYKNKFIQGTRILK